MHSAHLCHPDHAPRRPESISGLSRGARVLGWGLGLWLTLGQVLGVAAPERPVLPPVIKGLSPTDPLGVTWAKQPPALPPPGAPFLDPAAVVPGMRAVGYTVFEGDRIEPFVGTVVGTAKGMIGPQRDALIVRFEDARMQHVGIVHGMSGSPVYIGGALLGALSLALSPFPKDPLGGVTPILYMLDEAELTPAQGTRAAVELREGASPVGVEASHPGHPAPVWRAWGIDAELLKPLEPLLGGPALVVGASAASSPGAVAGASTGNKTTQPEQGSNVTAAAERIQPGSPIAAILVEGDANITATGTTTWRQGEHVLAFGHPFLSMGRMAIPMATAEVVTTVADQTYPYKLANVGVAVGTMTADRVTAVAGRIGPVARLIPVTVQLEREGQAPQTHRYRVADDRELAPPLYQLVLNASLRKQWRLLREGVFKIDARIRLAGGREIHTQSAWTFVKGSTSTILYDVVDGLSDVFSAVVLNPFQPVVVEEVRVEIQTTPEERLERLVSVRVPSVRVRAGETLPVTVVTRTYLGGEVVRQVEVPIPAGLGAGTLTVKVQDFRAAEADPVAGRGELGQAQSFEALLGMLERSWRGDRLYVRLERKGAGARVRHQVLPGLPGSVRKVLELSASSEVAEGLEQEVLWEGQLEVPGTVLGSEALDLELRAP